MCFSNPAYDQITNRYNLCSKMKAGIQWHNLSSTFFPFTTMDISERSGHQYLFSEFEKLFFRTQDLGCNPSSATYLCATLGKSFRFSQNQSGQEKKKKASNNLYHISKRHLIFMKINSIKQTFIEHPSLYFKLKPS